MSRCPTCGHDPDPSVTRRDAVIVSLVGAVTLVALVGCALMLWGAFSG